MLRLLPNKIIAHDAVASPLFRLFFCRLLFFIPLYKKEDPKFLINQLFFFFSLAMEFATNLETKTENNVWITPNPRGVIAYKLVIWFFLQKENVMIQGDPRYDPDARKKKIADLKVKQPLSGVLGSPAVKPYFAGEPALSISRTDRGKTE